MFKKIVMWCEFPEELNWKRAESLVDKRIHFYVACTSLADFKKIQSKTNLKLKPWPILSKEKGYWFSGFTEKEDIDSLDQYKGMEIKVDLEPPLPKWRYSTIRMIGYGLKKIFQKGKNSEYLKEKIEKLAKSSDIELVEKSITLVNEFPFPKWYLKRQGIFIEPEKHMHKNIMCYTTFAGPILRPIMRLYLKFIIKSEIKKNSDLMCSIGLIGPGILKTEKVYKNINQFKQDLDMINKLGVKKVAIYSLDTALKREDPKLWFDLIKNYLA